MLNNWCGQGRLVKDVELRYTQSQVPVATFTLACERDYKPKEGDRETDWIDVVAWNSSAEFVSKYFQKGDMIVVNGRIQTRNYEDKNGNKRKATEIIGTSFNFCGGKNQNRGASLSGEQQYGQNRSSYGNYGSNAHGNGGQNPYGNPGPQQQYSQGGLDDFMNIPNGIDESLPFN